MSASESAAGDVYDAVYEPPTRTRTRLRTFAVLIVNVFTAGAGPVNPGGGRYRIVTRSNGVTVGHVAEWLGDDAISDELHGDLARLSPDAFAHKWL